MDGFVSSENGARRGDGLLHARRCCRSPTRSPRTFTLANRWFCSVPGPTYPNRRFLLAGTAFGGTATNPSEILEALEKPPPNGTIFDRSQRTASAGRTTSPDIPMTARAPVAILLEHLDHHHPLQKFLEDCKAGTLPQVSFVDPKMGPLSSIADALDVLPRSSKSCSTRLDPGETEEDPDDMYYGERWAHEVVEAVLRSPAWPRTLLIYTYDEHGGYYDHVPPPPAVAPDDIAPNSGPGTGDYTMYGPRVPPSSSRRTRGRAASATSSTTTPRSSPPSSTSGTFRRSPTATPTPPRSWTSSTQAPRHASTPQPSRHHPKMDRQDPLPRAVDHPKTLSRHSVAG